MLGENHYWNGLWYVYPAHKAVNSTVFISFLQKGTFTANPGSGKNVEEWRRRVNLQCHADNVCSIINYIGRYHRTAFIILSL